MPKTLKETKGLAKIRRLSSYLEIELIGLMAAKQW